MGTHWMIDIVSLIISKGDPSWVQRVKSYARSPWIETGFLQKDLMDREGPRLLTTHLPIQLFPKSYFTSNAKVIYVIRNPRDVLTSCYHDLRGSVEKICQFLGKKLETEELDSVLLNSSFSVMKDNQMSAQHEITSPADNTIISFPALRKGICEDWKNHFTVAQSETFDKVYQEKMSSLDPALFPWP
ncbi:3-beta-hydroxysteroid sulfotransferase-like [Erethizon dorsatum]